MTNVYLYGELRNKFGEEFKFNINSAKEALLAINSNKRGFLDEVKRLAMRGIHYRIIVDDNIIQNPKEVEIQKNLKEIHIVPIVWGAGKNGAAIGMAVVGIALVALTAGAAAGALPAMLSSFGAGGGALSLATAAGGLTTLGSTVAMIGAGLALQGIMGILYPPPKPDFNQEVQAGGKSYLFGNKPSNTSQGQAVPVGYGRLKIGSSQISSSIDHYALNTDIKQLMTPVDKPTNDYIELIAEDETSPAGITDDGFTTNQAVDMDDTVTFCSVNILNSYIDITTNSVDKVFSAPVEVVVTRNGEVISNPDLTTFDTKVTYEWEELSTDSSKGKVFIENPYATKPGLAIRSYHTPDFKIESEFAGVSNTDAEYYRKYSIGELVKFGPAQFNKLKFAKWDLNYNYVSGELVDFPTGSEVNTYFQAIIRTGFSGELPTGEGDSINSYYWRKILPPNLEYLYKCTADVSGHLPATGKLYEGAPYPEYGFWTRVEVPTTEAEMNTLFSAYPAFNDGNQYIYEGEIKNLNEQKINKTEANVDNYGIELLGYFYVSSADANGSTYIKDIYEIGTATGLYEIMEIGDTGQWSGVGFTGINGVALTPRIGSTFCKNNAQATGDGKVMLVQAYRFKLDSDDASDLYIDSTLASSYYGGHDMFAGFADPENPTQTEINALPSTTTTLYLTAGYHRLYARLNELRGSEGVSIYYKYDTNRDDVFSDWQIVPKNKFFYNPQDLLVPKTQKYADVGKRIISVANMIYGEEYKIHNLGSTTNWTSIGASPSENNGTVQAGKSVFVKNSTPSANGNGFVVEDFITYSEQKSAESNRIVRFISERPTIDGIKSSGYSRYRSRYRCKVNINNKQIIYSAPVKVNISFLSTPTKFRGIGDPILSQQVQI